MSEGLDQIVEKYTGKSIKFPLSFTNGRPDYVSGFSNLKQAVRLLLTWEYGERFYLSAYGNPTINLLDENVSQPLLATMRAYIQEQLRDWEPRIQVLAVKVRQVSITKIDITINYKLTKANITDTMVVPFYITPKY